MKVWMILGEVLGLGFFTFVLIKATDLVMDGLIKLSRSAHVAKFGLAAFLLALSTSFPELFVGVSAAVNGEPNLSLGNVIGSNIANLSLIMGGAALIGGSVAVLGDYLRRDFIFAFLAGSLPMLLLMDGSLTRLDGVVLLLIYGYYLFTVFHKEHTRVLEREMGGWTHRILRQLKVFSGEASRSAFGKIFLGTALIILSAEMVVRFAQGIAIDFHVPMLLVGMFLVAVGTSLPELALSIKAITNKQVALVFGNLLGSTVANSTLIIGLTALIQPIEVVAVKSYLLATIAYVLIFWLFWFLTRTKRRLDRWEGVVLILVYLVFMFLEFAKINGYAAYLPKMVRWILAV